MAYKQRTGVTAASQLILTDDPDFLVYDQETSSSIVGRPSDAHRKPTVTTLSACIYRADLPTSQHARLAPLSKH